MVVIRLSRGGAKKQPFYHVVATDRRNRRDGRFIERLGYFNPVAQSQAIRLKLDQARIDYWLSKGAQPSDRVSHLIKEFAKMPEMTGEAYLAKKQAAKPAKAKAAKAESAEKANEEADKAEASADNAAEKEQAEASPSPEANAETTKEKVEASSKKADDKETAKVEQQASPAAEETEKDADKAKG